MSLPETCPFCGASVLVMEDGKECRSGSWVTFGCLTMIGNGIDGEKFKSRTCEDAERARLSARVAELEARCKRLEEVGDMIVAEYMVVEPEKSAWRQAKEAKL